MSVHQFTTFIVDNVLYGLNILQVREVIQDVELSPVPGAHSNVLGLMNLRGQIVSVVDLAMALGHEKGSDGSRETCIILKTDTELAGQVVVEGWLEKVGSDKVGLLVDNMAEVVEVDEKDIDASPANTTQQEARFVQGVVKLDSDLLTILSLERVLDF